MYIIYSKLPKDVIDYILCFTPYFIIRKGILTSIISKEDDRYKMLQGITIKPDENPKTYYSYLGTTYLFNKRYDYGFHDQDNSIERKKQYIDDDSMSVVISINKNGTIHYDIGIYKLKPKEENSINRRNIFYKGNMNDCDWNFITYQYNRN